MNNLLENKIREHAEELFGGEPFKGHRERFTDRLDAVNRKKMIPVYKIISYISIAAVFAGCVFLLQRTLKPEGSYEGESLAEVQMYYSMQLQEKIDNIEQLIQQVDEEERIQLMKEIESLQQEAAIILQESDEKNTAFIVMVYTHKIDAVEHIYHTLSEIL